MWTEWTKWTKWTECSAAPFNNHTVRALACGCYRILLSLRRIFGPPLTDLSLSDLRFTQCPLWSGFAFDLVFWFPHLPSAYSFTLRWRVLSLAAALPRRISVTSLFLRALLISFWLYFNKPLFIRAAFLRITNLKFLVFSRRFFILLWSIEIL